LNGVSGRSWVQTTAQASPKWTELTWKYNKWSTLRIQVMKKVQLSKWLVYGYFN
jgi:hypothetical protein